MLGLRLIFLGILLIDSGSFGLVLLFKGHLWGRFKSLAQREVSVDNNITVLRLVLLSWSENNHLSWNPREGVRCQEVLSWHLVDEDLLHHGHMAADWNIKLK